MKRLISALAASMLALPAAAQPNCFTHSGAGSAFTLPFHKGDYVHVRWHAYALQSDGQKTWHSWEPRFIELDVGASNIKTAAALDEDRGELFAVIPFDSLFTVRSAGPMALMGSPSVIKICHSRHRPL